MSNFFLILPEIYLAISAILVLLVDMFIPEKNRIWTYRLTIFLLSILSIYLFFSDILFSVVPKDFDLVQTLSPYHRPTNILNSEFVGQYASDSFTRVMQFFSILVAIASLILSKKVLLPGLTSENSRLFDHGKIQGEFFALTTLALLGQFIMIAGHSLLVIYLGIELMSLALYSLTALRRENFNAIEAATKYFILGALASGLLLYGMSMIYGATGSLSILEINRVIQSGQANPSALIFGIVFLVAALAFKFGLVPFHMWIPDVYQGANTPVTLLIATVPKIAVFVVVVRLLFQGLMEFAKDWQLMVLILSLLSIALGNIVAIAQSNIKRMLAYSAIAQIGFMLLGFFTALHEGGTIQTLIGGYGGSLFYLFVYIISGLLAFGILIYLSENGDDCEKISELKGLNQRNPWLAFLMLIAMFSMAGIPPLGGFYAKFLVLQPLIHTQYYLIALWAIFFSLVGTFYYLRIVKVMYFDNAENTNKIESHQLASIILNICAGLIIYLGLFPNTLSFHLFTMLGFSLLKGV